MREAIHIPEDDLIQYALGTLPEIQLGTLTAHISLCNQCRDELMRTQVDLASYATIQPQSELPAGARERFLVQIAGGAAESKFAQIATNSRIFRATKAFKEWLETPMPLKILSGALAAAMLFLAYDDAGHIHQIRKLLPEMKRFENATAELDELKEFLRGANVQQVALHDRPVVTKSPEGHALYAAASGRLIFTATGMAAPPAGKAYELWLLPASGTAPIPAGVFSPDIQGNAAVIFPKIPVNVQAGGFGVTLEDAAGSPTPTSPILLSGQ